MLTYFARHTRDLDIDDATRRILWEGRLIAMHFPGDGEEDTSSLNPEDYEGAGQKAMRLLVELASIGGYVCAQYQGYDDVQVGKALPRSKIELLYGKWGKLHGHEGRPAILKSLRLNSVKIVKPSDYATILVGRPRQGTLNRWPSAGPLIESLVENRGIDPVLASLSFRQQEILCSEFLRLPEAATLQLPTLASLVLPVGRTMKDVDVIGLATDGRPIFAQVTFSEPARAPWKLERLLKYHDTRGCHLLLFCDVEEIAEQQGVTLVPLRKVFTSFTATDSGKRWLSYAVTMCNREDR